MRSVKKIAAKHYGEYMMLLVDPFMDASGNPKVVRGTTVPSNSTRIAEVAGMVGFDTVWLDLEHGTASFTEIELLCMAVEAAGAVPTVRIQDSQRTHVLRALEAGARILMAPMIDTAEQAAALVEFGKYAPLGKRGFNMNSRGAGYGIEPPVLSFEKANARTHIFAQVETLESVENIEAMCAVEGLAGIFVGPGDLSVALGKTAQFDDPEVIKVIADVCRRARAAGKHAGVMAVPGPLHDACLEAGADLFYFGSELSVLIKSWRAMLEAVEGARG